MGSREASLDWTRASACLAIAALWCLYLGVPLSISFAICLAIFRLNRLSLETLTTALKVSVALYPLYIALAQYQQWWAGDQGLDFGIFAQLIQQVATNHRFETSLISTEWQNFFTHHFSPYLIVLGGIARLGPPPEVVLIGAHALAAAFIVAGTSSLARDILRCERKGLMIAALAILSPAVRRGMVWETHDDILALPLLICSVAAFVRGNLSRSLLLLTATLLFKETAGLVMAPLAAWYGFHSSSSRNRISAIGGLGLTCAILLLWVFPHRLWIPTFDPSSRIGTLEQLLSADVVTRKISWLLMVALPSISFITIASRRRAWLSSLFLAPIVYSLGSTAVTAYEPMLDYRNYYAITPSIFLLFAACAAARQHHRFSGFLLIALALTCLTGPSVRVSRNMGKVFSHPSAHSELSIIIPPGSVVVVDDYAASVLFDTANPIRMIHARRMMLKFDYLVQNKRHKGNVPESLKSHVHLCHETAHYTVWCASRHDTTARS